MGDSTIKRGGKRKKVKPRKRSVGCAARTLKIIRAERRASVQISNRWLE